MEKEVSLDEDENILFQKYFDFCLENFKKGQLDIVKSVGKIIKTEIMDKIIDSCGNNKSKQDENCKSISIKFLNCTQTAYETE